MKSSFELAIEKIQANLAAEVSSIREKIEREKEKSETKTNKKSEPISHSKQKYIETIFKLQGGNKQDAHAHVKDIAAELGIKMASVSGAAKHLKKEKLIYYHARRQISLTVDGMKMAADLKSKHQTLFAFFNKVLNCDYKQAESLACEIEHIIDENVRKKIENLINEFKHIPRSQGK